MSADTIGAALAELARLADTPEKREAFAVCSIAIQTIVDPTDELVERVRRAHAAMNGTDERRGGRGKWVAVADAIIGAALSWPYLAHSDAKAEIARAAGAEPEWIDELVAERLALSGVTARALRKSRADKRALDDLTNEVGKTLRKAGRSWPLKRTE